jgi:hypothetical protein
LSRLLHPKRRSDGVGLALQCRGTVILIRPPRDTCRLKPPPKPSSAKPPSTITNSRRPGKSRSPPPSR